MAFYIMLKLKEIHLLHFWTQKSKPFPEAVREGDNRHPQNITYSAFNASVLQLCGEVARLCHSSKDLDSGANSTPLQGRRPCFCLSYSLTRFSTSTHGTLGSPQTGETPVLFFCRNSWKRSSYPGSQRLATDLEALTPL